MATTRTELTSPKKTVPSSVSRKAPGKAARAKSATGAGQSPGEIIAERYHDTAYEALVGRNGENVSAAMSAGEAILAGMAEVSQEMMDFAGNRLRQDMELAEDLANAKTPEEIFEKQCSIAKLAAEQYIEETSKLIGMMARIQQHCWAPVEECTKAALYGVNDADDEAESEK